MASENEEAHLFVKMNSVILNRSFETFGNSKMDLYAVVEYCTSDSVNQRKKNIRLGRTKTLWGTGMQAEWNHTCKSQVLCSSGKNMIKISVYEDNFVKASKHCGDTALLDIDQMDLINKEGPQCVNLPLFINGDDNTGNVEFHLWCSKIKKGETGMPSSELSKTMVPADAFETPVQRLGVSGGTAPFFKLEYKGEDVDSKSRSYYIGKDLSRASDEIIFYETLLHMKKEGCMNIALNKSLLDFTFDYAGVLKTKESGVSEDEPELELLCLRNLYDGITKLRLLDIKMGQRTAAANWQGKSRARAMKQQLLDGMTNSTAEGFRLEGFDGPPPALDSFDPLHGTGISDAKSKKKALRFTFQNFQGKKIMMHLLDTHQEPAEVKDKFDLNTTLSATEYAELVLDQMVTKMTKLCVACHNVAAPQKWIGSSVALGFDSGKLPSRDADQQDIRNSVICSIFDWGRSELNTVFKQNSLSEEKQNDRYKFWKYYTGGIDRLSYDTANLYYNRFSNSTGWKKVTFYIFDYDSMTNDDFIGKLVVPFSETNGKKKQKLTKRSTALFNKAAKSSLEYSITYITYPSSSRLLGSWRVTLHNCENLPRMDGPSTTTSKALSDPYCILTAESLDSFHCFNQISTVKTFDLNPVWEESFDFPVARMNSNYLSKSLGEVGKEDYKIMFGYDEKRGVKASMKNLSKNLSFSKSDEENKETDECFSLWSQTVSAVSRKSIFD